MDGLEDASTELPPEAEAQLAELRARQQARRDAEARQRRARRGLWLSHHWPDEYDRCVVVGDRHVCRRCLALYPLALVVMIAGLAGVAPWPERLDRWFIWLLCIPATIEFVAEKLGGVEYRARRQVVVTLLVALALGRGLAHELDDRWSWEFWGPVLVFGTIWFVTAVASLQRALFRAALENSVEYGPGASDAHSPGAADLEP